MKVIAQIAIWISLSWAFQDSIVSAEIWTVLPDGTGDAPTIQAAIVAAGDGDVVELGDGVFTGEDNRDISFVMRSVTVRSQSGNPGNCIIDCGGSAQEWHRGFRFLYHEDSGVVVEGLTITNGYAGDGGGIDGTTGASPIIRNCVIRNNTAIQNGGGISFGNGSHTETPQFENCLVIDNTAGLRGGGAYFQEVSPTLTGCTVAGNSGASYGGGLVFNNCVATVSFCTIYGNTAPGSSGIWLRGTIYVDHSMFVFGGSGQAVEVNTGQIDFQCCNIFGNSGGDWTAGISDQLGVNGNIWVDPQFCSTSPGEDRYWALQSDSPCAPENSGCGQIGAWGPDCGTTRLAIKSWGGVKVLFR